MDVTNINNQSIPNIEHNNNIRVPVSSNDELPVDISTNNDLNYDKVVMNLEDVKNFLFMCIGGNITKVPANQTIGHNLNTLA